MSELQKIREAVSQFEQSASKRGTAYALGSVMGLLELALAECSKPKRDMILKQMSKSFTQNPIL